MYYYVLATLYDEFILLFDASIFRTRHDERRARENVYSRFGRIAYLYNNITTDRARRSDHKTLLRQSSRFGGGSCVREAYAYDIHVYDVVRFIS